MNAITTNIHTKYINIRLSNHLIITGKKEHIYTKMGTKHETRFENLALISVVPEPAKFQLELFQWVPT